jgi:hypothetical protein
VLPDVTLGCFYFLRASKAISYPPVSHIPLGSLRLAVRCHPGSGVQALTGLKAWW